MKSPANPYVGPRTFQENERLYGRDRELADLMDLLIAERIVLLYSPSGAGKSSLLQAGLIPAMKARGFTFGKVIRVNAKPPEGGEDNRYAASMMASLQVAGQPLDIGKLTLSQFLDTRQKSNLLVFDQFEEVITVDPFNVKAKVRFFDEIGEALRDRGRWAVFSMREDYLARLDPYLRRVPTHLSNTFRLDLLSIDASVEAIRMNKWTDDSHKNPADVDFTLKAAQKLAGNLSGLDAKLDLETNPEALAGRFVEPVQLQVACFDLWERLPDGTRQITPDHIEKVANIDEALGQYYARETAKLAEAELKRTDLKAQKPEATPEMKARALKRTERDIRVWFGQELIRGGIRAQVMRGDGLSGEAVDLLEAAHLVRSESRLGSSWVELAHDRLIKPVQKNNALWLDQNLSELQKRAELWDQQKRDDALLVSESETLNRWERDDPPAPQSLEEDFLKASRAAEKERLQAEQRRLRDIRIARILKAGSALLALLLAAAVWAFVDARKSQRAAVASTAQAQIALAEYDLGEVGVLVEGGQMAQASAFLARALRGNPASPRARAWAAAILSRSSLRIPSLEVDHQSPITRLVLSGDGTRMLTTYDRGSSRVWDLKTGKQIGPAFAGASEANLNWDGTIAVLWELDSLYRSGHVFDVATGKELGSTPGSKTGLLTTEVNGVVFGKNPREVFTWGREGVQLWDIDAQKALRSPRIKGEIQHAAFNADRSIVLILLKNSALVWRVSDTSGGNLREQDFTSAVITAAISPDGNLAAIVSGNKVVLWNIAAGVVSSLSGSDNAVEVGFTGDGQYVVATGKRLLRLWNSKTALPDSFWQTDYRVEFRSGQQVLMEESDRLESILLRDTHTFDTVARVLTRGRVDNQALSADGRTLATAAGGQTQAEVWDVSPLPPPTATSQDTGHPAIQVRKLNAAQIAGMVAAWQNKPDPVFTSGILSQDGSTVLLMRQAYVDEDQPPEVRDAKTGARVAQLRLGGAGGSTPGTTFEGALSDDGKLAAIAGSIAGNSQGCTQGGLLTCPGEIRSTGEASVFDLASGQPVGQPWTNMPAVPALRFTHDGSHLIMGSSNGAASLWSVPSGGLVGDAVLHAGPVTGIALSSDFTQALTTSGNQTITWDLYLGSGSSNDANALADLAEAVGGMRLAPGSSTPVMIPLAHRLSMLQNLAGTLSKLDPHVAAAIAGFQKR